MANDFLAAFTDGYNIADPAIKGHKRAMNERAYGEAYKSAPANPWGAVSAVAGARGDLQTAESAGVLQVQQEKTDLERMQRSAAAMYNLAVGLARLPYDQRAARVRQWAPMLHQRFGVSEEDIARFDPTDEAIDGVMVASGQFSQFVDTKTGKDGAIYGVDAYGNWTPLVPAPQARVLSPEEAKQLGFKRDAVVQRKTNGDYGVLQQNQQFSPYSSMMGPPVALPPGFVLEQPGLQPGVIPPEDPE